MATNDLDRVVPLNQLDDFEVADGEPDVRGWSVTSADGKRIGRVDQLLVDTEAMKVRYLDVDLREGMADGSERHALVPIGYAVLDRDSRTVRATGLQSAELGGLPAYEHRPLTHQAATDLDNHWTARGATSGEARITLSEEQLAVRKRERAAGAVEVEKHVETQHVRESVPLSHEEVTVERRPVTDPMAATGRIGEEHIRVPLSSEEAVVDKRVVPKEELVVRKQEVTENEVVEADLRRERAEVHRDDTGSHGRGV
jgi:uncharacterized protein (TIGR02271 family)